MLIDETVQPIDVWTTIDLGMQEVAERSINRQCAAGRAGRAGHARPRRRGAGDGRRARLSRLQLQPRDPGDPPARLVVQALRLSGRAGGGLYARIRCVQDAPITIGRWSPRNCNGRFIGPDPDAQSRSLIRSTPSPCASPRRSAPRPSPTWRSASASPRGSATSPSMALGASEVRLIDMTRAYAAVARGGVGGHALRHPPGDDRRRHPALPASGRSSRACWSSPGSRSR